MLVVFLRRAQYGGLGRLQALLGNAQVETSAVRKFLVGTRNHFFEKRLSLEVLLLLEKLQASSKDFSC